MNNLNRNDALRTALTRSNDSNAGVRLDAIVELIDYIDDGRAFQRLVDMLDDDIINVEEDAAEALARHGGTAGILAVLENLGRRGDDGGDSDYVANRMDFLDNSRTVRIFELFSTLDENKLSENQILGIQDMLALRGE